MLNIALIYSRSFLFTNFMYGYVDHKCIAKIYFSDSFHYTLLQYIHYSSQCYTGWSLFITSFIHSRSVVANSLDPGGLMCFPPGSHSVHGFSRARILEYGLSVPSPGESPEHGSNPGSPAWKADSYGLSNQGSHKCSHVSILTTSLLILSQVI